MNTYDAVSSPNQLSLLSSHDAKKIIAPLSKKGMAPYALFQPELDIRAANILLKYVLQGKQAEAKRLIATTPRLLFIPTHSEDYAIGDSNSHRIIVDTPYGAAVGAEDVDMLKMMAPYIDKVESGRERAAARITQHQNEAILQSSSTYDFTTLVNTILQESLTEEKISKVTEEALAQFRTDFRPTVVKKSKHFDCRNLIEACKLCEQNYPLWTRNQVALFFCRVIGYLERLVPTCYAQALCQGLYHVADEKKPLTRTLALDNGTTYFPLDVDPNFRLGFDFGVYPCVLPWNSQPTAALRISAFTYSLGPLPIDASRLEKLCQTRTIELEQFKQRLQRPQTTCCMIS